MLKKEKKTTTQKKGSKKEEEQRTLIPIIYDIIEMCFCVSLLFLFLLYVWFPKSVPLYNTTLSV